MSNAALMQESEFLEARQVFDSYSSIVPISQLNCSAQLSEKKANESVENLAEELTKFTERTQKRKK